MLDGVALLLEDLDGYIHQERLALLCRGDLPGPLLERFSRGDDNPLARSLRRLWTYHHSRVGPLQDDVQRIIFEMPAPLLELGAGIGAHGRSAGLTAVELDWVLLSRNPAERRVVADALAPPFAPGGFASVVALNLLDSCRAPLALLQALDAQLAPGGALLLASPFAYEDQVTPIAAQLDEAEVEAFFFDRGYTLERAELPWPLQTHPRTQSVHAAVRWRGRKPGGQLAAADEVPAPPHLPRLPPDRPRRRGPARA